MPVSTALAEKISDLDPKLRGIFESLIEEVEEKTATITVGISDFKELKDVVKALAKALQELAQAQQRTETTMEALARAQERTESEMGSLMKAQEESFQRLSDQIAALGARYGIYKEATFRSTILDLLSKTPGVQLREGYYGDREVDVIIRDGEHVLLEITSRMHGWDIERIYRSADDYRNREGIEPTLMVATSYVSPKLMQRIMGLERKIDIFSYDAEEYGLGSRAPSTTGP